MSETFFLYLVALIFSFVLGILLIWWVGMSKASQKLAAESQKLQLKLNQAKSMVTEYSEQPQNLLGDIGIDGLMDAFGIPSIFKPIAKGFIDKVTQNPELLASILKKVGVDINIPSKEGNISTQV
jgi:type II secretory pathway pseudopilin PulG